MKLRDIIEISFVAQLCTDRPRFSFKNGDNCIIIRLDSGYCNVHFSNGEWNYGHKIDYVFEFMEIVSDFIKCWKIFEELKLEFDYSVATRYVAFCVKRKINVTLETYNNFINLIKELEDKIK